MKQYDLVGVESMQCIHTNMHTSTRNLKRLYDELKSEEDQESIKAELYCVEELIACAQDIIQVCETYTKTINYSE